ncbi:Metalloreductase steap2 [Basidiobolus ranarum]|uniref:Metalloreductase steap2 n=1 Tax=Basidiobolus ranarum TaxID=34480 RepID=A0ABR2VSS8_9FUNG
MSDINLVHNPDHSENALSEKTQIAVLGTGWFGRAMSKRLLDSGYQVLLGTRNPTRAKGNFKLPVEPVNYVEAIQKTDIVILCLPQQAHSSFIKDYGSFVKGKIVIDVTNPLHYHSGNDLNMSIAENLQAALPEARVVKAFNTLSAYSLEVHTHGLTREVYICTNDPGVLRKVSEMVRKIGYTPVDSGTLAMSRSVEAMPLSFFENWRLPLAVCAGLHIFFFLYLLITRYVIVATPNYNNLPLFGFNSTVADTALGLFSLANLAGCVANIFQLVRGRANQPFPPWLANWLNSRKQLGLLGFLYMGVHIFMSTSYAHLYRHIVGGYINGPAQAGLLLAHISALIYSILWVVSLPSVGNLLSWREWRFIQSTLGWTALALGFIHTVLMVYPFWMMVVNIPNIAMLGSILPVLAFILKFFLLLPPVQSKIQLIQQGKA